MHKQDKECRPCCVILHRNHLNTDNPQLITKTFLYMVDIATQLSDTLDSRKLVVIYDWHGYDGTKNKHKDFGKMVSDTHFYMSNNYPERLHKFYVIGVNILFRGMYMLAKPFLAKK